MIDSIINAIIKLCFEVNSQTDTGKVMDSFPCKGRNFLQREFYRMYWKNEFNIRQ